MKVNNLEFYTYPFYLNNINYAIINCKHFIDFKNQKVNYELIKNYSNQFNKVLLEPEVLILKKQSYYRFESWLNINEFLINLPKNCYFTMDYPNDMNENYSKLFIEKLIKIY